MWSGWSGRAVVVAAAGLLVLVLAVVAVITDPQPRLAATNSQVVVSGSVVTVAPGVSRCQAGQFIPDETARLRVFVGTVEQPTGEPLLFSIGDANGALVSQDRVEGGYPPGALEVPVQPPDHDLTNGEVCIANLGSRPMAFAGHLTPANRDATQQQGDEGPLTTPDEEIRVDFFRSGRESLWAMAPEVARRFSLFKPSFAGPRILWVVLGLAGAVGSMAVLVAVRQPFQPEDQCRADGGE